MKYAVFCRDVVADAYEVFMCDADDAGHALEQCTDSGMFPTPRMVMVEDLSMFAPNVEAP